jgi:phage shock protein A
MADTLKTRVARVIAGGAHALLDKIEDAAPVAMLEQSVRELDQVVDEVRAELGRTAANRHLAQQQHLHLNKEHEALSASLATAVADGRDDLATPAISRQLDIEAQLPILESSLAQLASEEKELSGFVDALMGKKREMERAIAEFERSRATAASALANNGGTGSNAAAKANAAQSSFDRTYRRQTGLDPAAQSASMQQAAKLKELNDLVRDNKIAERLAALKAQQK